MLPQVNACRSLSRNPVKQQNRKPILVRSLWVGASAIFFTSFMVRYSIVLEDFLYRSFFSNCLPGFSLNCPSLTAAFKSWSNCRCLLNRVVGCSLYSFFPLFTVYSSFR